VTDQPDLFSQRTLDPALTRKKRDEAIERVGGNASPEWKAQARAAVVSIAYSQDTFTSDDVWVVLDARGVPRPHEGRALGAVMMALVREGVIRKTGEYRQTAQPKSHGSPATVWSRA